MGRLDLLKAEVFHLVPWARPVIDPQIVIEENNRAQSPGYSLFAKNLGGLRL
jgi:hypothetical protein